MNLRKILGEHGLEPMYERDVEEIDPIGGPLTLVVMAVPIPVRSKLKVSLPHRKLRAVDDRKNPGFCIENQPHRIGGVAMGLGVLSGFYHLISRDNRANRIVIIVVHRIEH